MTQRRIHQIDADTGEILEATLAVFYPKRRNGFREGFFTMTQGEQLMQLANAKLGEQGYRVLLAVLNKLDFENYLAINQAEIGRALSMRRNHVSTAIKRLTEEGILLPGPKIGVTKTYTLNPRYGWKGSAKNHNEALSARMKNLGLSIVGETTDNTK